MNLFADKECTVSLVRDERPIYIYRENGTDYNFGPEEDNISHLTQMLSGKVGGVLGLGAT